MTTPHLCVVEYGAKHCSACGARLRGQDLLEARQRRAQVREAEARQLAAERLERQREYERTPEGQAALRARTASRRRFYQLLALTAALGGGR
jgi:hypothetical protein